jgi:hypothetical protein
MAYFTQTAVLGVDALMDLFNTQLVAQGWTSIEMQTSQGVPAIGEMGKERWWRSPGSTAQPAFHMIGMTRLRNFGAGANHSLGFQCASGSRNSAALTINSIETVAGTTTIETSVAHNARVGDIVLVNGVTSSAYNIPWTTGAAPETVTAVNTATEIETTGRLTGTIAASSGGSLLIPYNFSGSRGGSLSETFVLRYDDVSTDPSFDVFGYVDELRMAVILVFGGVYKAMYLGLTGRGHVQDTFSDVALTTGAIVGTGVPQTVNLNQSSPNMKVTQDIYLIPPDDANGDQLSPRGNLEVLEVTAKPSATQVEIAPNGDYSAGALIGFDPSPCVVCGDNNTGTRNLELYNWTGTHRLNGQILTNPDDTLAQTRANLTSAKESTLDPDEGGNYQGAELWLHQTTGIGARYPLVGLVAWPHGAQNDFDLMVVGEDVPANRWKVFTSMSADTIDDVFDLGVGPGAT